MAQEQYQYTAQAGDISLIETKIETDGGDVHIGHIFNFHAGVTQEELMAAMQMFQIQLTNSVAENLFELRVDLLNALKSFLQTPQASQLPENIRVQAQALINITPSNTQALRIKMQRFKMLTSFPQPLPDVIERTTYLEKIKTGFAQQAVQGKSPIQIVQGGGGFGKTQLAALYASRYCEGKSFVYWVCADEFQLKAQWQHFGELLGLELKELNEETQRQKIRQALSQYESWFIVLDNLEDQVALRTLLPAKQLPAQQVLITTRNENWGARRPISVSQFTPPESFTYLTTRLQEDQHVGAVELAIEMEHMPLALSHAVAYMQNTGRSAEEYLALYRAMGIALLREAKDELESGNARPDHIIFTTYQIAIEKLSAQNSQAAELVKFCAYLHPEGIEEYFLKVVLGINTKTFDDCLRAIRKHALLSRDGQNFKMHRLVQDAIRYDEAQQLPKERLFAARLQPLAKTLHDLYPHGAKNMRAHDNARSLKPHLIVVANQLSSFLIDVPMGDSNNESTPNHSQAILFTSLGDFYLHISGDAKKSLVYFKQASDIFLHLYGEKDLYTALGYRNLGHPFRFLGEIEQALDYDQKALKIYLRRYRNTPHLMVADSYSNLGVTYRAFGKNDLALECYKNALQIQLKFPGEIRPDIANSYNNMGNVYRALGDPQALICHHKALDMRLKLYGEKHPDVAQSYDNLGMIYRARGDYQQSFDYHTKALEINSAVYGETHPNVAVSYNNLGLACDGLEKHQEALENHGKALGIFLAYYGETHPQVAKSYKNLGIAYWALNNSDQALVNSTKALEIDLKVYQKMAHYDLASSYENVGILYQELKKVPEAQEHLHKALLMYQELGRQQDVKNIEKRLEELLLVGTVPDSSPKRADEKNKKQSVEEEKRVQGAPGFFNVQPSVSVSPQAQNNKKQWLYKAGTASLIAVAGLGFLYALNRNKKGKEDQVIEQGSRNSTP